MKQAAPRTTPSGSLRLSVQILGPLLVLAAWTPTNRKEW